MKKLLTLAQPVGLFRLVSFKTREVKECHRTWLRDEVVVLEPVPSIVVYRSLDRLALQVEHERPFHFILAEDIDDLYADVMRRWKTERLRLVRATDARRIERLQERCLELQEELDALLKVDLRPYIKLVVA